MSICSTFMIRRIPKEGPEKKEDKMLATNYCPPIEHVPCAVRLNSIRVNGFANKSFHFRCVGVAIKEERTMDWREYIQQPGNYDRLFKMCLRLTRSQERAEEVMSDVVLEKLQANINTFDPAYDVPLEAHIMNNSKWYVYKWLKKQDKHRDFAMSWEQATATDEEPSYRSSPELDSHELLHEGLKRITQHDRLIIVMTLVQGITIRELAEQLKVSVGTAHSMRATAIKNARKAMEELS